MSAGAQWMRVTRSCSRCYPCSRQPASAGDWVASSCDAAPLLAPSMAIGTAWPTAIAMLPITASAIGIRLQAAIGCFDVCTVGITSAEPLSGFGAYLGSAILASLLFLLPPGAFLVALLVARWLGRHHKVGAASGLVVVGYAVLHFVSIFYGGAIPFACLALGVVTWAALLHERVGRLAGRGVSPPEAPLLEPLHGGWQLLSGFIPGVASGGVVDLELDATDPVVRKPGVGLMTRLPISELHAERLPDRAVCLRRGEHEVVLQAVEGDVGALLHSLSASR